MDTIEQGLEGKIRQVKINGIELKLDKAMTAIIEKAKAKICQLNNKKFTDMNEQEQLYVTEQAVKIAVKVKEKENIIREEREREASVISNDILLTINDLTINKACKKYILDKLGKNAYINMRIVPKQAKIDISDGTVNIDESLIDCVEAVSIDSFLDEFTELRDNKTRETSDTGIVGSETLQKIDDTLPLLHERIVEKGDLIAKYTYRILSDIMGYGVASTK